MEHSDQKADAIPSDSTPVISIPSVQAWINSLSILRKAQALLELKSHAEPTWASAVRSRYAERRQLFRSAEAGEQELYWSLAGDAQKISEDKIVGFGAVLDKLESEIVQSNLDDAVIAVNAGVLALVHTALDSAIYYIVQEGAKEDCRDYILKITANKKLALECVRELSPKEIEDSVINKWLRSEERQSVVDKLKRVFAMYEAKVRFSGEQRNYMLSLVEFLSQDRHDAIHRVAQSTIDVDVADYIVNAEEIITLLMMQTVLVNIEM